MNLEKFMEKKFPGLIFLPVATEQYQPGLIINSEKKPEPFGKMSSIISGKPAKYWTVDLMKANLLAAESISGSLDLKGNVSFLGLFRAKTKSAKKYSISYTIEEVNAAEFKHASELEIVMAMDEIKKKSKSTWKRIRGKLVVKDAFYARAFTVSFKREGQVLVEADIKSEIEIEAKVDLNFSAKGKIIVSANREVPFAIRAFKIRG